MINGFQSINTITSGLILQQLEQEVNASNVANPSVDPNGYLMNSLEAVNVGTGAPITFGSGNNLLQIGTGPFGSSITRLRNSFLDSQIQQESTVLGQAEVLANAQGSGILNQIQNILAGGTTLNTALNNFAASWAALGSNANPSTDGADRATVVQTGIAFAQLANSQFNQLENLQASNGQQINNTVVQINGLLQQLASINNQLLSTQGSNPNTLLDARDYALDRLARLVNIQTNFAANGTVNVYLGGSSVTLVDVSGAAIFQTNPMNTHYPDLVGITIQTPEGGFYGASAKGIQYDIENSITGGNLGGELQAQYVILNYQRQVDQIATSVINVTNNLHESGYAADGVTTGTAFFSGTGAVDISVDAQVGANSGLVAAAINPASPTNGLVAKFLSNLPNILGNNFIESANVIGFPPSAIDPTQPIGLQPLLAGPTGPGQFTVNGVTINWTNADSIDTILNKINTSVSNVYAVYNATTAQFFMYSNKPIQITNLSGNFTTWANIANVLTSTIRMNNYESPNMPLIDASENTVALGGYPLAAPLNSTFQSLNPFQLNAGPNSIAFKVVPSPTGAFTINGNTFVWNNTMSLAGPNPVPGPNPNPPTTPPEPPGIGGLINIPPATYTLNGITSPNPHPGWNAATGSPQISFNFDPATQTVSILSQQNGAVSPQPIVINDLSGNFTVFTGLNGSLPIGSMASGIVSQVSSDAASHQALESQASNSLTQLNNAQANIAGVSTSSGQAGVPIATIEQQAMQSLISYNAMLEVLQVIDNMYVDLVNMVGGSTSSISLSKATTPG